MHRQAELPGFVVGLEPMPDETLFSWCSRYHRLAANGQDRTTCLQLFGHHRTGTAHDFPARVNGLVDRMRGLLGTAQDIVLQRTLLPFYLPFRSPRLGQEAIDAMRGSGIGHLKYRLGLLTSGLGAAHPLKACPACVRDESAQYGWSWWHRTHQLPGVWVCTRHPQPLWVSPLKLDQVARFAWTLPYGGNCQAVACLQELTSGQLILLRKLEAMNRALLDCVSGCFDDPVRMGMAFRRRLGELDMTSASCRLRWARVDPVLQQLASHLTCVPELNHQADPVLLRSQFLRLLSGRSLTHPLRYVVWVATWFESLDDFQQTYAAVDVACERDELVYVKTDGSRHGPSQLQRSVLQRVIAGHITLSAAARQTSVSYATMAAWASKDAFEPSRRPKKLHPTGWQRALEQLRRGSDKEIVAFAHGISVVTVTRILCTVPGLQEQWHEIRHEQRRAHARGAWMEIAGLQAHIGRKSLRRLQPAAYAWLYRNDREWLTASFCEIPRQVFANHAATRIENADTRMAAALRNLAARSPSAQSWNQEALKRAVPRIGKAIQAPERWPQTVRALAFILNFAPTQGVYL